MSRTLLADSIAVLLSQICRSLPLRPHQYFEGDFSRAPQALTFGDAPIDSGLKLVGDFCRDENRVGMGTR